MGVQAALFRGRGSEIWRLVAGLCTALVEDGELPLDVVVSCR